MEERCALCEKRARIHCNSDQANLCWDCDEIVHSANFLVAKHSRILLCRLCRSPTPWKASGPKLTPTDSLCHQCVANQPGKFQQLLDDDDDDDDDHRDCEDDDEDYSSDPDSDNGDDEDEDEEEELEAENQVVPWSFASDLSPPPCSTSSDAGGDISTAAGGASLALKRLRDNSFSVDSEKQDDIGCSLSLMPPAALPNDESNSMRVFRPLKQHRNY